MVGSFTEARVIAQGGSVARAQPRPEGRAPGALRWPGSLGRGVFLPRVGVDPQDFLQVLQRVQLDSHQKPVIMEVSESPPPLALLGL